MAWIQWGENAGETTLVVKTRLQAHEDLLMGNPESGIEGVVPTVTRMTIEHGAYRKVAIALQALVIIGLGILGYRNETKPPQVIIQQVPQAATPAKRSYVDPSDASISQPQKPQDARIPYIAPPQ